VSARGGTGRRVWFRPIWGTPWRFESSRAHLPLVNDLEAKASSSVGRAATSSDFERSPGKGPKRRRVKQAVGSSPTLLFDETKVYLLWAQL
jgi:hypothetical protein